MKEVKFSWLFSSYLLIIQSCSNSLGFMRMPFFPTTDILVSYVQHFPTVHNRTPSILFTDKERTLDRELL